MQIHQDYFSSPHHTSNSSSCNAQSPAQPAHNLTASPFQESEEGFSNGIGEVYFDSNQHAKKMEGLVASGEVGKAGRQADEQDEEETLHPSISSTSSLSSSQDGIIPIQSSGTEIFRTPSASTTHTQSSAVDSFGSESQDSNGEGTVPSSVGSSSQENKRAIDDELEEVGALARKSEKGKGKMRNLNHGRGEEERAEEAEDTFTLGSSREGSGSTSTPVNSHQVIDLGGGSSFPSRSTSPSPLSPRSGAGFNSPRSKSTPAQAYRDSTKPKTNRTATSPESSTRLSSASADPIQAQRKLRRLYALLELVETEKSYAQDMNALVKVYFSQLSSMPFFSIGNHPTSSSSHSKSNSNQTNEISSSTSSISIPSASALSSSPPLTSSSASSVFGSVTGSPVTSNSLATSVENSTTSSAPTSPLPTSPTISSQERLSLGNDRLRSVTRNAEELLHLTNKMSAGLSGIVDEAGIAGDDLSKVLHVENDGKERTEMEIKLEIAMSVNAEAAVHVIAQYFNTLAPSFSVYKNFASRHAEALAVVREAERRTSEWAAYEKRCADILRRNNGSQVSSNASSTPTSAASSRVNTPSTSRRGSDISGAAKPSGLTVTPIDSSITSGEGSNESSSSSLPAAPVLTSATSSSSFTRQPSSGSTGARLVFADFFIKPIQRLCLLPLMLQSVLKLTSQDDTARPALVEAVKAMRQVADDVDEAGRQREMQVLAHLIATRMERNPIPTGPSSYSSSPNSGLPASSSTIHLPSPSTHSNFGGGVDSFHSQNCTLTSSQLNAFGACLLAGSLDVLHHHSRVNPLSLPLRFKYHGVFLYQGWIMLVKVQTRRPHAFEARHWFPLWAARLTVLEDSKNEKNRSLLPHSFRISVHEHHFDMGVSTAAEKQIWVEALSSCIRQAEVAPPKKSECASWPSSLQLVADGELEEEEEVEEEIDEDDEQGDKRNNGRRNNRRRSSIPDPLSNVWAHFPLLTSSGSAGQSAVSSSQSSQAISSSIPLKLASPSQRASHDRYMLASQSLLAARTKDSSAAHDALVLWQKQTQHSLSVPSISAAVSSKMGLNKLGRSSGIDSQFLHSSSSSNLSGSTAAAKLQRRKSFASVLDLMNSMTASPDALILQHQQQQLGASPTFRHSQLPEGAVDPETTWRSTFKRRSNKPRPSTMIITPEMLANVAAQSESQPKSSQSAPDTSPPPTSPQSAGSPPLPPPLDLSTISPTSLFAPDGTLLPISAVSNASMSPGLTSSQPQSMSQSQVGLSSPEQFSRGHSRTRSGASISQAVRDALSSTYGFGGGRSRTRSSQTTHDGMDLSANSTPPNLSPMGLGNTIALPGESRRNSISSAGPASTAFAEFGAEGGLGLVEGEKQPRSGSLSRGSGSSIRRALTSTSNSPSAFKPFLNLRANSSRDSLNSNFKSSNASALASLRSSPNHLEISTPQFQNTKNSFGSSFVSSLRRARSGSVTSLQESSSSTHLPNNSSSTLAVESTNNDLNSSSGGTISKRRWPKLRSGSSSPNVNSGSELPPMPALPSPSASYSPPSSKEKELRRPSFGRRLLSNRFSMISSGVGVNSQSSPSILNSNSMASSAVSSRRTSELDAVVESVAVVTGKPVEDVDGLEGNEGSLSGAFEKDATIRSRPNLLKRTSTIDGIVRSEEEKA